MKKISTLLLAVLFASIQLYAEKIIQGERAEKAIPGSEIIRYRDNIDIPVYVKFKNGQGPLISNFQNWASAHLGIAENMALESKRTEEDALGFTHYRFNQKIDGIRVEFAEFIAHVRAGKVEAINGYLSSVASPIEFSLDEASSLSLALHKINASVYNWQVPEEEMMLKISSNDPEATWYPKGEMVYFPAGVDFGKNELIPAWKFSISAVEPLYGAQVYVDARNGDLLFEDLEIKHADSASTALTYFSGLRNIVSDFSQGTFYLRESGRGNGIFTYDMLNTTNIGSATILTNDSSYWHDTLRNRYGTDAHWGAEQVYDYYLNVHGRNSLNDNGLELKSYVHYGNNYANAFWNGNGRYMAYGDGNSSSPAFTALDVCGHEFTHGVDQFTSDLVYVNESGALDESFADIFGNAVEAYVKPNATNNWLVGEDRGSHIRSMSNPKQRQDPDTYFGTYFVDYNVTTADNGGVHTNSGVQNHWFYLLSVGGSGSNDNNDTYNVTGITIQKAEKIAYRNRTVYLTSNSDYADARFYSIMSADDLYGNCSQEFISTWDAWYAVGVGPEYTSVAESDFEASVRSFCNLPAEVNFTNLSNINAGGYTWDFGDGGSDTVENPSHLYMAPGTYTVKLTTLPKGNCNTGETETKTGYIIINPPADVQVSPYSICEGYPARIRANAPNQAYWFLDSASANPIFVGNPFVSQALSQDTFFYAANGVVYSVDSVGIYDNTTGSGGNHTTQGYGLAFDVLNEMTLESVTIFNSSAGFKGIEVVDANGNTVGSAVENVPLGKFEFPLNILIPPGNDYKIRVSGWVSDINLYRNDAGVNYPYDINGLVSITRAVNPSNASVPGYYYYFYNWKVRKSDCIGQRFKVPVTIDFDPDCVPYLGVEEENNLSSFTLYPNPSNGLFTLEMGLLKDEKISLQLVDSRGALVYEEVDLKFEQGIQHHEVEAENLSPGIYVLLLNGQSTSHSERILIE